ncbi:MAG TPA: hypothetical protein VFN18_11080 [Solirubrobacterales bacterium]|nr:hypothetical protein [Solirubrobacterales bacterium]
MTVHLAAIELVGLKLVGDRPLVVEAGPLIGSLIIALVAGYAARLAARTANKHQAEQLEHDTKRQEEAFARDAERLERQLEHDRAVRRREHVRDALDGAIELLGEVTERQGDLLGAVEWCEERREEPQLDEEGEAGRGDQQSSVAIGAQKVQGAFLEAGRKLYEMYPAGSRLKVRLGSQHEICEKYDELIEAWKAALDSLQPVLVRNRSDVEKTESVEANNLANLRFAEFMVVCEAWLQ